MLAERFALALVVCAAALSPAQARAEDPRQVAAREFRAGSEAYARREFRTAAQAFDRAYVALPRTAALYSAGLAWQGAGDLPRAADELAAALATPDLAADQRADAQSRLAWLRARLGRLQVNAPDGSKVSVAHVEHAPPPVRVHLAAGKQAVRVEFRDGRSTEQDVVLTVGTETVVDVVEPAVAAASRPVAPSAVETPPTSGGSTQRTLAWIAFGGAAVAALVNAFVYEEGNSARDQYVQSGRTDASLYDTADTYFTASKVAWVVTGAFAATGVVLYFTAPRTRAASSAHLSLRVWPTGAAFESRF